MTTVKPTIASPQLLPTRWSWMNTMTDSNTLISGENASSMTLARGSMRARGPFGERRGTLAEPRQDRIRRS